MLFPYEYRYECVTGVFALFGLTFGPEGSDLCEVYCSTSFSVCGCETVRDSPCERRSCKSTMWGSEARYQSHSKKTTFDDKVIKILSINGGPSGFSKLAAIKHIIFYRKLYENK